MEKIHKKANMEVVGSMTSMIDAIMKNKNREVICSAVFHTLDESEEDIKPMVFLITY